MKAINARVIDADPDPMIGELLEADLPDAPGQRFLKVRCGTGREFVMPVPATMVSARQANASTYGYGTADLKQPEIRT